MNGVLVSIFSRVAGSFVAALAAWLTARGIDVGDTTQLTASVAAILLFVAQVVYAVVHRFIDRRVNPKDAAVPSGVSR